MSLERQFTDIVFPMIVESLTEKEAKELLLVYRKGLEYYKDEYLKLYRESQGL